MTCVQLGDFISAANFQTSSGDGLNAAMLRADYFREAEFWFLVQTRRVHCDLASIALVERVILDRDDLFLVQDSTWARLWVA
jgi:hypothetical protein